MGDTTSSNTIKNSKIYYNFSNTAAANTSVDKYGKDTFLKILAAELSNQDPMSSGSGSNNTEYISQMAQFSALEQMQSLNTTMTSLLNLEKVNQGTALIGNTVNVKVDTNKYVQDVVKSVDTENGKITLTTVSGKTYTLDQVVGINTNVNADILKSQRISEAAIYINETVNFAKDDGTKVAGLVTGIKVDNGQIILETDKGNFNVNQVTEVGVTSNGEQSTK